LKKKGKKTVMADTLRLDDEKGPLKAYYAGLRMQSPNGGYLMLLGVHPLEGGTAVGIFECSASSLRYEIDIPIAIEIAPREYRGRPGAEGDRYGRLKSSVAVDGDGQLRTI